MNQGGKNFYTTLSLVLLSLCALCLAVGVTAIIIALQVNATGSTSTFSDFLVAFFAIFVGIMSAVMASAFSILSK